MNTTPEQIADLTKAHTSAHQDLLNFASSIQTRMTKLETDLQERTTQLETALQSQFIVAAPVGSLIVHAAQTPPSGWFECDGATKSRTDYADLFNTIGTAYGEGDGSTTFNLPDLRGEFVRGWDHGRGVDAGRVFGGWQDSQNLEHKHSIIDSNSSGSVTSSWHYGERGGVSDGQPGTETLASGGNESRPRNLAMIYCIRF